ncbi:MAG: PAS domain-containing sensor histidine kinase [Planctomycetota bacterium]|jgi:PAS domain S-box-containing protein
MTRRKRVEQAGDELYRAAEKRLLKQGECDTHHDPADTTRLIHELQVHQVELEIQNEELCQAQIEAEDALSKYADLYDFAPFGYLTVAADGVIRSVNFFGAALLERERSELTGRRLGVLVSENDRSVLNMFLEQVFDGAAGLTCEVMLPREGMLPRAVRIAATVAPSGEECRLIVLDITKAREDKDVLLHVCDDLETLVAERTADLAETNMRLQQDIAERKRVEIALLASEKRYQRLLSSISSYVYRVDIEDGIASYTEHGEGCEAITGYTPEDYSAETSLWISMIPDEDRPKVIKTMDSIVTSNEPIGIQHRVVCKDGSIRWIHNTLVPHHNLSGTLTHYDGVITDITEHKQHQEELINLEREAQRGEALRFLGQLAVGVAHEVRNPLNSISITIEILAEQLLANRECTENIDRIRRQVNRLNHLMKDLLELRRPEDCRNSQRCKVTSLCRMAIDIWKESNRTVQHKILIDFSPEADCHEVLADQERMIQVLVNLLNNAMQHSAEGSEIHVSATGPHEGFATIQLRDQGQGFSETGLQQAFDPFFSTRTGGSGLGLSISKHIIETYSGTISIWNNTPPPGCTVEIRLPVATQPTT